MLKLHGLLGLTIIGIVGCSSTSAPVPENTGGSGDTSGTGGAAATGGISGSSSGGRATGGADATGGGMSSGGSAGESAGGAPGEAGAELHDKVYAVACPEGTSPTATSCQIPNEGDRRFEDMLTFGGTPGVSYEVTLHFCAAFEGRQYENCETVPDRPELCIDGTPAESPPEPSFIPTYPTLALKVSDPEHVYYLNANFRNDRINKLDYSATFPINGGATVTFESDGGSNSGVYTARQAGENVECPDVPGIEDQPYLGQFIHIQVETVEPTQ